MLSNVPKDTRCKGGEARNYLKAAMAAVSPVVLGVFDKVGIPNTCCFCSQQQSKDKASRL